MFPFDDVIMDHNLLCMLSDIRVPPETLTTKQTLHDLAMIMTLWDGAGIIMVVMVGSLRMLLKKKMQK